MKSTIMTKNIINSLNKDMTDSVSKELQKDLRQILLFGSCARGDFDEDSDVDVALLLGCSRKETKKYDDIVDEIATDLAMKYFAVVNFVLIPMEEYIEKKDWYGFYKTISEEGQVLYG